MTFPYPTEWACGACHRKYVKREQADKCCTKGHEEGWAVG